VGIDSKRALIVLAAVILVGVLVRSWFVGHHADFHLYGDQIGYHRQAKVLTDEGRFEPNDRVRPPLYPLFLALVFRTTGGDVAEVRVIQALLTAVSLFLCYLLAREFLDRSPAVIATGVFAFYPLSIQSPVFLLSEILFTPPLILGLIFTVRAFREPRRWRWLLLAGAAWGFAALTRSVAYGFFLILLPVLIFQRRPFSRGVVRFLVFLCAFAAVISPWALRNAIAYGAFIPISDDAVFNIWFRGTRVAGQQLTMKEFRESLWAPIEDRGERSRTAVREGLKGIAEDPPFFLRSCGIRFRKLWFSDAAPTFVRHKLQQSGGEDHPILRFIGQATRPAQYALVILGFVGILLSLRRRSLVLLSSFLLYLSVVHSILGCLGRYRIPIIPLLAILVVWMVTTIARDMIPKYKTGADRG